MNFENLLVLSPHADDETLGCGGLLHAHKKGRKIVALCACSTVKHRTGEMVVADTRKEEFGKACLSFGALPFVDDPLLNDRLLNIQSAQLLTYVERAIDTFKPDAVAIPGLSYHQDHVAVNNAAYSALRPGRFPFVSLVFEYETHNYIWSNPLHEFRPNAYLVLTPELFAAKMHSCALYKSQGLDRDPNRSTIEMMIKRRGWEASQSPNLHTRYAEAYRIIQSVFHGN